jgi:thioredoxin-like negative regulator of GroEL
VSEIGSDAGLKLLDRGEMLCELRRFDAAEQVLRQALAQDSTLPRAWCLLAQAQLGRGRPDSALSSAETAAGLDPDDDWPHRLRSIALLHSGRAGEAVEAASRALSIDSGSWQSHACLADAFAVAKPKRGGAVKAALRAVAIAPEEPDAHFALGGAAAAAGRRDQAAKAFRRVLSLDPQHAAAHNELARLQVSHRGFSKVGGIAAAAEGFATAIRADPSSPISRLNLDLTLRSLLAFVAYTVSFAAVVSVQLNIDTTSVIRRVAPVAILVLPVILVAHFVPRLSPSIRRHFLRLLAGPQIIVAAVAVAASAVTLAGTLFVANDAQLWLAGSAIGMALLGRLLLERETRQVTEKAGFHPGPYLGNRVVWVLALAFTGFGVFMLVPVPGAVSPITMAVTGAVSLVVGLLCLGVIIRRKRVKSARAAGDRSTRRVGMGAPADEGP